MVVQVVDADLFGAPKKWHSFSQVHMVQGKSSGTAYLLWLAWNALSHLPPPTLPIFPKTEFGTRGGASLEHIENQKRIKVLWKDPLLHEQARTSRLIIFWWCWSTSCVCTRPGKTLIYSPLKGLNSSGRGRSCSVCPSGLPNLSHLKGESHYKEGFPLLSRSTLSHFNMSSLFGSYCC